MPAHTRGFTLIEILVVLVIISIITAVAVLSLGSLGGNPAAKQTAQKLAALTDLVSQQAVMRGQQYGLLVSPHAYEFLLYDGSKWLVVQDDQLLRARQLDSSVTLSLQLEGTPISLPSKNQGNQDNSDDSNNNDSGKPALKPQIMLLSSGEITPFKITVSGGDKQETYLVTGDLQYGIQFVPPDTSTIY
ncbi:MAG: type II secretion system minor pseudopilin GspH, partial [Gammaproteobacteria bacterium]